MKKILVVSLCMLLAGGAFSFAKEERFSPVINASSTVSKEILPNYVQINISVLTKNKIAEEASKQNAEISSVVVTKLKGLIDNKKGDMIETLNYNLSPQYNYKDGKNEITGYSVTNTIKVKIRDVKSVSAIIDEALISGANNISELEFGYDDEGLVCNELYAKATRNAYSQAQSVAKALGTEVIGTRKINTSCHIEGQQGIVRTYKLYDSAMPANGIATPIETKSLKVVATIDGTFNIK